MSEKVCICGEVFDPEDSLSEDMCPPCYSEMIDSQLEQEQHMRDHPEEYYDWEDDEDDGDDDLIDERV